LVHKDFDQIATLSLTTNRKLVVARFAVQRILSSAAFRDAAALLGRFLPN
jgi:hypothetical protein